MRSRRFLFLILLYTVLASSSCSMEIITNDASSTTIHVLSDLESTPPVEVKLSESERKDLQNMVRYKLARIESFFGSPGA